MKKVSKNGIYIIFSTFINFHCDRYTQTILSCIPFNVCACDDVCETVCVIVRVGLCLSLLHVFVCVCVYYMCLCVFVFMSDFVI